MVRTTGVFGPDVGQMALQKPDSARIQGKAAGKLPIK
jgi:hypothetical protein